MEQFNTKFVDKGDKDDETHLWGRSLDFKGDGLISKVVD